MTTQPADTPDTPAGPAEGQALVFSPAPQQPGDENQDKRRKYLLIGLGVAVALLAVVLLLSCGKSDDSQTATDPASVTSGTIESTTVEEGPDGEIISANLTADSITTDPFTGNSVTEDSLFVEPGKAAGGSGRSASGAGDLPSDTVPTGGGSGGSGSSGGSGGSTSPSTPTGGGNSGGGNSGGSKEKPKEEPKPVEPGRVRFEPLTDSVETLPGPIIDVRVDDLLPKPEKGEKDNLRALLTVLKTGKEEGVFMLSGQVIAVEGLSRKAQCWPSDEACGRITLEKGTKVQMLVARTKGDPVRWYLEYLGRK